MKRTLATHKYKLQLLMIEIYKTKQSLNQTFKRDVSPERNNQYNLGNENHLRLPVPKTTSYGLEILNTECVFCGPHSHQKFKDSRSLSEFKRKIKQGMEVLVSTDYVEFLLEI